MTELSYDIVDVFSDRPYSGNPLAVVHGGENLNSQQMQTIAAEFGLSETTFPLPPTESGVADYRVRIFTTVAELPFAGHPSIGTAWVLAQHDLLARGDRIQECGAGLLPVHVGVTGARVAGGTPAVGESVEATEVAETVGLRLEDIDTRAAPGWASAGHPYLFLLVRTGAVARVVPDQRAIQALTRGPNGLVVCALNPGATQIHARMFAPGSGTPEDPATGSAAVALGVYLADRRLIPAHGEHAFTVTQGIEIGRHSTLRATVTCREGTAVATTVEGDVAPVARGDLRAIPPKHAQ